MVLRTPFAEAERIKTKIRLLSSNSMIDRWRRGHRSGGRRRRRTRFVPKRELCEILGAASRRVALPDPGRPEPRTAADESLRGGVVLDRRRRTARRLCSSWPNRSFSVDRTLRPASSGLGGAGRRHQQHRLGVPPRGCCSTATRPRFEINISRPSRRTFTVRKPDRKLPSGRILPTCCEPIDPKGQSDMILCSMKPRERPRTPCRSPSRAMITCAGEESR